MEMKNKYLMAIFTLIIITVLSACNTFPVKESESNAVAENLCFREGDGTNSIGAAVLINTDIVDVEFSPNEQQEDVLNVYFELTNEGQKKLSEETKKLSETSGYLSFWIGDEMIVAAMIQQPITDNQFVVEVGNITENNRQCFMDKVAGISEE